MEIAGTLARLGNRILSMIAAIIILLMLLYGGYSLWDTVMVYRGAFLSSDLLQFKPAEDAVESPTLLELQAINPDVQGWLTIDDTHIDYPVVQGENDMEYVNKDVYGEIAKSDLDFNNEYGGVHTVTVTKKVQGGFANASDTFEFEVTVNGSAANEAYKVVYTTNGTPTTKSVVSGGKIDVTLGKDDTVTIYGLSENDSYTITEKDVTNGKTATGYTVTDSCGTTTDGKVEGFGGTADSSYIITNTKVAPTPTGVAMTVAPYILMVAVAGIFAILFLRRRHEEA